MQLLYFAWIDEAEEFDPEVHNRIDENVFSHSMAQQEGNFATLKVEIVNPRIGLLNPGRQRWCFYSFDDGLGNVTPLIKARIMAVPDNIFDTVITLQFIAKPSDWAARKHTLADTLRVRPYWDQLLIAPEAWADDDTVLEARSAHWHIHPVTHEVTISDVLVPEDGVFELTAGQFFRDGMSLQLQQVPLRSVTVDAVFPWVSTFGGRVDLGSSILRAFPDKDPLYNLIWSYTFEGLSGDWPKTGAKIGDGWAVADGQILDQSFLAVSEAEIPFYFDKTQIKSPLVKGAILFQPKVSGRNWSGVDGAGHDSSVEIVIANPGWGKPVLTVDFAAARDYAQTLRFTMEADIQPIATEATEDESTLISLTANKLTDVGFEGEIALARAGRSFLDTPRGLEATEHCLLIARAVLCIRSRAVHISYQCPFQTALLVTLRKAGLIHDPRLPGGQALGKVIEYEHSSQDNQHVTTVKIGCAIGYGGSHTTSAGDGVYAAAGYMQAGYQQMENAVIATPTSDITYEMPRPVPFDDGVDGLRLTASNVIKNLMFVNSPGQQATAINAASPGIGDQAAISTALQAIPTQIQLELIPLGTGPHLGNAQPSVSTLIIPKQIDLEAAST